MRFGSPGSKISLPDGTGMTGEVQMEALSGIGGVIFKGAWVVGVAAWILGLIETVSLYGLTGALFNLGPIVLKTEEEVPRDRVSLAHGERIKLNMAQFKFTGVDRCIFSPRFKMLDSTFPIKGTMRWRGSIQQVEARIPLGLVLFTLAWLVGWTAGPLMMVASSDTQGVGVFAVLFALFGWFFVGLFCFIGMRGSRKTAKQVVAEIAGNLAQGGAPREKSVA